MSTTVEGKPDLSSNPSTVVEAIPAAGLGATFWRLIPGKRIPEFVTKLVDGILLRGIRRMPSYEEHKPPYDLYLLALELPPTPERFPVTEDRLPLWTRYIQTTGTVAIGCVECFADAKTHVEAGVSAELVTILSTAEGLPEVSGVPSSSPNPIGVSASPA